MIQLLITKTGKGYNPKDGYTLFDRQIENFKTITDAYGWIKETYGKAKGQKCLLMLRERVSILDMSSVSEMQTYLATG